MPHRLSGHSVVPSGDTRPSENLVRHAQGVDVLVHAMIVPDTLSRAGVPPDRSSNIIGYHLTPEQAGEIAVRRPKAAQR
jgi:ribonuclease Z